MKNKILVIEDEINIREGIKLNLDLSGYEVIEAVDGQEGLEKWKKSSPDLIVLDIMLPFIDGYEVLKEIRSSDEKIPILILSAKDTDLDKVKGLSEQADDYLSKPFNLNEFLLRVERLLVRSHWNEKKKIDEVYFGDNYVNFTTFKALSINGERILTVQEAKFLKTLVLKNGQFLTRQQLLKLAWDISEKVNTRTIDNFMARFRKYFEKDPKNSKFFISKRSQGYMFINDKQ